MIAAKVVQMHLHHLHLMPVFDNEKFLQIDQQVIKN